MKDSSHSTISTLWQAPPASLSLPISEIHLWRIQLDQPIGPAGFAVLSADERQRADRYRRAQDRQHFVVGRARLRQVLGQYLAIDPAELQFGYGDRGKPFLVSAPELQFNVSHSHGLALYAVRRDRQVGVDVEYLPRALSEVEALAQRFFSPVEYKNLVALPIAQRQLAFLQLWTCKEAVLKAIGTGLSGLEQVEIPQWSLAKAAHQLTTAGSPSTTWSVLHLEPAADYVGALAIEGSGNLRCWEGL
ncbi:4'-phosphopantetheinyl transferase superfamily protein [Phormidium tenue FACHB-886]|nr:4'-phosphopantetheinyl transferase superfamily protein [Phormidium tenue FACHB-886]